MSKQTAKRVGVLTCVTNAMNMGPGHTALVVDSMVYTFETFLGGWISTSTSGWRVLTAKSYLAENTYRPVAVQELKTTVNATSVLSWIQADDAADSDYASSGICSMRAVMAVSAGTGSTLEPNGFNTPYAVYQFLEGSGLVDKAYYTGGRGNGRQSVLLGAYCAKASHKYHQHAPILSW